MSSVDSKPVEKESHWKRPSVGVGLALVSTLAPTLGLSLPQWLRWVIFGAGVILILWPAIVAADQRLRNMSLEPLHLTIVGLSGVIIFGLIALGGAILQMRGPSNASTGVTTTSTGIPKSSGNPLQDAIDAFLAKRGKTADYISRTSVNMGDASDGRGPFITYWDKSLGPWPTTADGFTEDQLRRSPSELAKNPMPEWGSSGGIRPNEHGVLVIVALDKMSRNLSTEEVTLKDAYLVSAITGERRNMKVYTGANELVSIAEIEPIPPGANVSLRADFNEAMGGITESAFLKEWGKIYFVAEYNNTKFRQTLDDELFKMFDGARPKPSTEPRVTKRRP